MSGVSKLAGLLIGDEVILLHPYWCAGAGAEHAPLGATGVVVEFTWPSEHSECGTARVRWDATNYANDDDGLWWVDVDRIGRIDGPPDLRDQTALEAWLSS